MSDRAGVVLELVGLALVVAAALLVSLTLGLFVAGLSCLALARGLNT